MAFTYLIGWKKLDKWYYGVRFAKDAHPSDLFTKYFTSSKNVHDFLKKNGMPDVIEIRKKFTNKKDAIDWESKVLTRMKVVQSEKWLNKTNNKAICTSCNHKWSKESREKSSKSHTGLKHSEKHKESIRKSMLGRKTPWLSTENHKQKMSLITSGAGNPRAISIEYQDKRYDTIKDMMKETRTPYYIIKEMINRGDIKRLSKGENKNGI